MVRVERDPKQGRLTITISNGLGKVLLDEARRRGVSISILVAQAVAQYIDRQEAGGR